MTCNATPLTELQKSEKYQRALSLNLDCGSDTLRKLIEKYLDIKNVKFNKYVQDAAIQNKLSQLKKHKVLYGEQIKLLSAKKPDLLCMDISLLTIILLELFPVPAAQQTNIKKLRQKRNELAHRSRSQLEDDIPFNEASQIIVDLSKDVSSEFETEIKLQIEDLKRRELVRTHSNLDIVKLHNESLMVKLVEHDKGEIVDKSSDIWIKYRLTRCVRTLSRTLDVDVLLQELLREDVIDVATKKRIEQTYNYEEQVHLLVLHVLKKSKGIALKFCGCLKHINSMLADMVLSGVTDDTEIDKAIKTEELSKIKNIISSNFVASSTKSVACEDVHILVDETRRCSTKFDAIKECVIELFPAVCFKDNDSKFHGVEWKDESNCITEEDDPGEVEENISDMPSDKFSQYINRRMEKSRTGIGVLFEITTLEECISSDIFSSLTPEQLENIYSHKLKEANIKFGIGIKVTLIEIQKDIKKYNMRSSLQKNDILRKFDTPTCSAVYTRCIVRPSSGNLLTPVHEFIFPHVNRSISSAFMAKDVIRFATACMNGKQNGTIHFGIKDVGNGNGEIIGLPQEAYVIGQNLNQEVQQCIKYCFKESDIFVAERCIRPVQVVTVDDNRIVFEVDIVSFSRQVQAKMIGINFPPRGNQREKFFVFRENMIATIEYSKLKTIEDDTEKLFLERVQLEKDTSKPDIDISRSKRTKLIKLLTGGNRYVTDAFTPVIFCGDVTGCPQEISIREQIETMAVVFTSSACVFEFGASVDLRNHIEREKNIFHVKLAEDYATKRFRRESDSCGENRLWVYSNGNEELGKDKMNTVLWYKKRLDGVKNTLLNIRQQIPIDRGLLIFLVFQKTIERDPMIEIARECFLTIFSGECIIIAENDDTLREWRKELGALMTMKELDSKIITGLKWLDVVSIMTNAFRPMEDATMKLPDSRGGIVEITKVEKEQLQFNDIEVVDGFAEENCRFLEENMTDQEWQDHRAEEEKQFYKGNAVTWWNFYYSNHVGKRDAFNTHREDIKQKILSSDRENKYEIHKIEHHPGAGGSTLGKQLIWSFSQIKPQYTSDAYRSCLIKKITEDTAEEIYRLQVFKESRGTKPVIALIDNESEDRLNILKPKLDELAYKRGSPGSLFCILLIVMRVPVSYTSREGVVLKHNLSKNEETWFDKKFKELETNSSVNVKTLIAFNVMRHSFDNEYIAETTKELMKDVTRNEVKLLKCLSLICSFESDHPVPESVFDSLMVGTAFGSNSLNLEQCLGKPFGLVWSAKERAAKQQVDRETWNVRLTDALQLLITHRRVYDAQCYNAVCILSQPLAEAVLKYILESEKLSFEDIVVNLLDLLRQHRNEPNKMSKRFVKLVCSLFKTRQVQDDRGEKTKYLKFSDLVLKLERQLPEESTEDAQQRVVRIMKTCFQISNDANIGQQLARFNNHIGDYEAAEEAIMHSLKLFPRNSYFLDTHGQIFKAKMEHVIKNQSRKLTDENAADFVKYAVQAITKFKGAQDAATGNEDYTHTNCYNMEVITALEMLESFHQFECHGSKENFWQFLNKHDYNVEASTFKNLIQQSDKLMQFRKGHTLQQHLENSLSRLQEMAYMTRNHLSSVITPSKDVLLLKPRERFQRFYGSKEDTLQFEFMYGVGLKLLMKAYENKNSVKLLIRRATEADQRLQQQDPRETERDLLVYLGYNIITMSNQNQDCDSKLYHKLLRYSTQLMELQRKKKVSGERRYIEAYLYYALLHWPLPGRKTMENLSHPETYKYLLDEWKTTYFENQGIKKKDQLCFRQPKHYFALADKTPGNDIVDLELLRHKWRVKKSKEGRCRKEVKSDDHWRNHIFEDCLIRLSGTVCQNGRTVTTKVEYKGKVYEFPIQTIENCSHLSNRVVTFVLGFSWMALTALDVRREDWKLSRQASLVSESSRVLQNPTSSENTPSSLTCDSDGHHRIQRDSGTDKLWTTKQPTTQKKNLSTESKSIPTARKKVVSEGVVANLPGKERTHMKSKTNAHTSDKRSKAKASVKHLSPKVHCSTEVFTESEAGKCGEHGEEWKEVKSKKRRRGATENRSAEF